MSDVIVHFAEKNRGDETEVYQNNRESSNKLFKQLSGLKNKRLLYFHHHYMKTMIQFSESIDKKISGCLKLGQSQIQVFHSLL